VPKAALASEAGAGPDIIISTDEQPQLYPDKLEDVSELANYLGQKYGGWFEICPDYCTHEGRWIAIPIAVNGAAMVYRKSMLRAAGFEQFPKDLPGFLKLCQALKAKGTPSGFPLGHATGDAGWTSWLLWAFGGRLTNEKSELALNSNETIAALEYAKELYQTFVPGTLSWLDPNNNKAFLAGEISLTMNSISIYYAAKTSPDSNLKAMVPDIQHAALPIGPSASRCMARSCFPARSTSTASIRMPRRSTCASSWSASSMSRGKELPSASSRTRSAPTTPTRCGPMTRSRCSFRDLARGARHAGYSGKLDKESATVLADFIIVDMFGEVCIGQQTPKEAAQRAEKRARRHYRS
jgi:multiple sugar transport system substrate-binding protein